MTFTKFAFRNGNLELNLEKTLVPPQTPPPSVGVGVGVCGGG